MDVKGFIEEYQLELGLVLLICILVVPNVVYTAPFYATVSSDAFVINDITSKSFRLTSMSGAGGVLSDEYVPYTAVEDDFIWVADYTVPIGSSISHCTGYWVTDSSGNCFTTSSSSCSVENFPMRFLIKNGEENISVVLNLRFRPTAFCYQPCSFYSGSFPSTCTLTSWANSQLPSIQWEVTSSNDLYMVYGGSFTNTNVDSTNGIISWTPQSLFCSDAEIDLAPAYYLKGDVNIQNCTPWSEWDNSSTTANVLAVVARTGERTTVCTNATATTHKVFYKKLLGTYQYWDKLQGCGGRSGGGAAGTRFGQSTGNGIIVDGGGRFALKFTPSATQTGQTGSATVSIGFSKSFADANCNSSYPTPLCFKRTIIQTGQAIKTDVVQGPASLTTGIDDTASVIERTWPVMGGADLSTGYAFPWKPQEGTTTLSELYIYLKKFNSIVSGYPEYNAGPNITFYLVENNTGRPDTGTIVKKYFMTIYAPLEQARYAEAPIDTGLIDLSKSYWFVFPSQIRTSPSCPNPCRWYAYVRTDRQVTECYTTTDNVTWTQRTDCNQIATREVYTKSLASVQLHNPFSSQPYAFSMMMPVIVLNQSDGQVRYESEAYRKLANNEIVSVPANEEWRVFYVSGEPQYHQKPQPIPTDFWSIISAQWGSIWYKVIELLGTMY